MMSGTPGSLYMIPGTGQSGNPGAGQLQSVLMQQNRMMPSIPGLTGAQYDAESGELVKLIFFLRKFNT